MRLRQSLGDVDVGLGHLFARRIVGQDLRLFLELVNGRFDPRDDASSPGDTAGLFWHVLRDGWVEVVLVEQFLHLAQFSLVPLQHVLVLVGKLFFDGLPCLDVLEVVEQVEGANGGVELLLEGGVDQLHRLLLNGLNLGVEVVEGLSPLWQ